MTVTNDRVMVPRKPTGDTTTVTYPSKRSGYRPAQLKDGAAVVRCQYCKEDRPARTMKSMRMCRRCYKAGERRRAGVPTRIVKRSRSLLRAAVRRACRALATRLRRTARRVDRPPRQDWLTPSAQAYEQRRRHEAKTQTRRRLQDAVYRGLVLKPDACERCGRACTRRQLHGHHDDYSKPLAVHWLCARCHADVDPAYGSAGRRREGTSSVKKAGRGPRTSHVV
jgi:hypothetical protein